MFATLFYKTLCVMLLCWLWRKEIAAWMPERMRSWGMRAVWGCLAVALWVSMPRYHLIGLSNGGSAITSAIHSAYAKRFKSITTVSCNLEGLRKVPCQVNFIGGNKDNSSKRMRVQCKQLQNMGVDASIFYDLTRIISSL